MPRTDLLSAVASIALLGASAAVAQTPPPATPATPPAQATPATPATAAPPAQTAPAARPSAAGNVIEVLTAQGNFTTLLSALEAAQLTEVLSSRPAITIFAPTDEAFAALPEAERTRLMDPANRQELRARLLYHVIVADVSSAQIMGAKGGVETAGRRQVLLDGTGEAMRVDGAVITRADIDASNGAVFAIDKVLNPADSMAPPPAAADPAAPATPATPAAPATGATPAPGGVSATTRPAQPGTTAPNGQPAGTTTTIASPPVPNPTDGQVDRRPDPGRTTSPGG